MSDIDDSVLANSEVRNLEGGMKRAETCPTCGSDDPKVKYCAAHFWPQVSPPHLPSFGDTDHCTNCADPFHTSLPIQPTCYLCGKIKEHDNHVENFALPGKYHIYRRERRGAAHPSETRAAKQEGITMLLRKCMETAVRLAITRHSLELDEDIATEEEVADDAAGACFGEECCDDKPIPEVTELLLRIERLAAAPVQTGGGSTELKACLSCGAGVPQSHHGISTCAWCATNYNDTAYTKLPKWPSGLSAGGSTGPDTPPRECCYGMVVAGNQHSEDCTASVQREGVAPGILTFQQADCPKCHKRITVEVFGVAAQAAEIADLNTRIENITWACNKRETLQHTAEMRSEDLASQLRAAQKELEDVTYERDHLQKEFNKQND